ncbi:hypothetical protein [Streptomyces sp. NBC_01003]|uniref:hypothetical protein n=1 Tax=Streptomyces sp. NBC_01003 TaxID=2903714 RepID=UPI00386C8A11
MPGPDGQALGLEQDDFLPVGLIERDADACTNRPAWNVLEDFLDFLARDHPYSYDVGLLAVGLPRVKSAASVERAGDQYERGY